MQTIPMMISNEELSLTHEHHRVAFRSSFELWESITFSMNHLATVCVAFEKREGKFPKRFPTKLQTQKG